MRDYEYTHEGRQRKGKSFLMILVAEQPTQYCYCKYTRRGREPAATAIFAVTAVVVEIVFVVVIAVVVIAVINLITPRGRVSSIPPRTHPQDVSAAAATGYLPKRCHRLVDPSRTVNPRLRLQPT